MFVMVRMAVLQNEVFFQSPPNIYKALSSIFVKSIGGLLECPWYSKKLAYAFFNDRLVSAFFGTLSKIRNPPKKDAIEIFFVV